MRLRLRLVFLGIAILGLTTACSTKPFAKTQYKPGNGNPRSISEAPILREKLPKKNDYLLVQRQEGEQWVTVLATPWGEKTSEYVTGTIVGKVSADGKAYYQDIDLGATIVSSDSAARVYSFVLKDTYICIKPFRNLPHYLTMKHSVEVLNMSLLKERNYTEQFELPNGEKYRITLSPMAKKMVSAGQ